MIKTLPHRAAGLAAGASRAARKGLWLLRHGRRRDGAVRPVFLLGARPSGASLLGDCLDESAEVRYFPEHEDHALRHFALEEEQWHALVRDARLPVVVFKPLSSHDTAASMLQAYPEGRVVWVLRHASEAVRCADSRTAEWNRRLLSAIAEGRKPNVWQARGLTAQDTALVRELAPATLDPGSALAVVWYLHNRLFFRQDLHHEARALVLCYERLLAAPAEQMQRLCTHIGIRFQARLARRLRADPPRTDWPVDTSPRVIALCDEMYRRLRALAPA